MTESWSVYRQVKKIIRKLEADYEKPIAIFDVCSGKGFISTLIALKFPKLKVFMIDHDKRMNIR